MIDEWIKNMIRHSTHHWLYIYANISMMWDVRLKENVWFNYQYIEKKIEVENKTNSHEEGKERN